MILITGATGNVGSELITALLPAQADQIRALTRNPEAIFPDGTEKVVADLGDSDLTPVLDGVGAVFLPFGLRPGPPDPATTRPFRVRSGRA